MAAHRHLLASLALLHLHSVSSTVTVPGIFSDGMVLQEHATYDQRPFIYGLAEEVGEIVTVIRHRPAANANDTYLATADASKQWIVQLDPDYFSIQNNNLTIFISGSATPVNTITIQNVVYGDVFLCSGQSNMNENVAACFDANETMALSLPKLRLFSMAEAGAATPQSDIPAFVSTSSTPCSFPQFPVANTEQRCNAWQSATSPTVIGSFSATCLYTALALTKTITDGRYIGLIHASVSGTGMKLWAAQEAISQCDAASVSGTGMKLWTAQEAISQCDTAAAEVGAPVFEDAPYISLPPGNSTLWNAMIAPISRFAIRAVIWDQGESDSGEAPTYFSCLFQSLVESWRRAFRIGDFSWVFAQLGAQDSSKWPNYYINGARLAQAAALPGRNGSTTNTIGMAVTHDLGDMFSPYPPDHVHARNKTEVGRRLALSLLHVQYALQYPSSPGLINLSGSVDWAPPRVASVTSSTNDDVTVQFYLDANATLLVRDTPNCWECCTANRDLFQVATAAAPDTWVNSTFSINENAVTVTPTAPGPFAFIRHSPNLWPQCVFLGSTNLLPPEPFVAQIGGGARGRAPTSAAPHPAPKTSTAAAVSAWGDAGWKGRPAALPTDCTVACTPPMGTNTWNALHTNLDDTYMRKLTDIFVSNGLAAAGYRYINLDDAWQADRYANGTILADPVRFPHGIENLAQYVHSKGLLFGLYTAQREFTCQQRPGSWRFEEIDIDTYCRWGIDYVKTDACFGRGWPADNKTWIDFRAGITRCTSCGGQPIVLSVESCNDPSPGGCSAWIGDLANLWRTTGDIQATFQSVLSNLDSNNAMAAYAGPGHWNDADMLQLGNAGLSLDESRSHFAAWAVIASPLLIATDVVSGLDADILAIFTAPEVIGVSQDPLGVQGVRVSAANKTGSECWARPLADGGVAALLLNRALDVADVTCTFEELGLKNPSAPANVRDLWTRADLGAFSNVFTAKGLAGHASMLIKVTQ